MLIYTDSIILCAFNRKILRLSENKTKIFISNSVLITDILTTSTCLSHTHTQKIFFFFCHMFSLLRQIAQSVRKRSFPDN